MLDRWAMTRHNPLFQGVVERGEATTFRSSFNALILIFTWLFVLIGSSGPRCIAKYDYDSVNPSDLAFKEGSVIKLLDNAGPQWLKGQHKGKTGIFPDSYVDIIEALPSTKKSTSVMNGNSGNNTEV